MKQYERAIAKFTIEEREATMGLVSTWEQRGIDQGRHEGKEDLVIRLIRRRFGAVADTVVQRIDLLTSDQLNALAEDFLDFTSLNDVEQWLSRQQATTN